MHDQKKSFLRGAGLIALLSAGLLLGCNSGSGSKPSALKSLQATSGGQLYTAQLMPLNQNLGQTNSATPNISNGPQINGVVLAANTAEIWVNGDNIIAALFATGLAPNQNHLAHIHLGSQCPTMADDTNGDGVLDVVEASAVTGPMLIDFGPTLTPSASTMSQEFKSPSASMNNLGLSADANGTISFEGTGSVSALQQQLQAAQPNADLGVGALQAGQPLDFSTYVVEIHGIDPSVALPNTVQSLQGLSASQTIPVYCGQLQLSGGTPAAVIPNGQTQGQVQGQSQTQSQTQAQAPQTQPQSKEPQFQPLPQSKAPVQQQKSNGSSVAGSSVTPNS